MGFPTVKESEIDELTTKVGILVDEVEFAGFVSREEILIAISDWASDELFQLPNPSCDGTCGDRNCPFG